MAALRDHRRTREEYTSAPRRPGLFRRSGIHRHKPGTAAARFSRRVAKTKTTPSAEARHCPTSTSDSALPRPSEHCCAQDRVRGRTVPLAEQPALSTSAKMSRSSRRNSPAHPGSPLDMRSITLTCTSAACSVGWRSTPTRSGGQSLSPDRRTSAVADHAPLGCEGVPAGSRAPGGAALCRSLPAGKRRRGAGARRSANGEETRRHRLHPQPTHRAGRGRR